MKTLALLGALLFGFLGGLSAQEQLLEYRKMQPQVVAVFPSYDTLPENLLRMYIHFSAPMKPVGNLEKIQVIDATGKEVMGAIFNNVHELWNRDQTHLTLLLDPSRVKTGLQSHETRGRALVKGKRYHLVVGELEDAEGNTTAPSTKTFVVADEDLHPPDIALWVIQTPKSGSRDPLIIQFPDMLDRLSLLQRIKLADDKNQPITGKVVISKHETAWQFFPASNWAPGDYRLYVHARLEDPAGNNLNGLFDHQPGTLKYQTEGKIETIELKITP